MSPRSVTALTLAGVIVGASVAGPALAAPKKKPKPITKTYEASAFPPDPTPILGANNPANPNGANCNGTVPQAQHLTPFKVPAAGTIEIWLTGFQGDWALGLRNKAGKNLADSDQDITEAPDRPEHIKFKIKSPTTVTIAACNFLGGPTATVKYVFTFA